MYAGRSVAVNGQMDDIGYSQVHTTKGLARGRMTDADLFLT